MPEPIKISIITPSFNQAEFIERTIKSVLSQVTRFSFEMIIVDGRSTDNTIDILKKYSGRLKWISETDDGQANAINKGINMAEGDIIGWLNSDDTYLPGTLEKVAASFDKDINAKWLYGRCKIVDNNDCEIRRWVTAYKNLAGSSFSLKRLLTENYLSQPSVFFKKESFTKVKGLDIKLHYALDYDLWIRLGMNSQPLLCREYLSCFRIHTASKSKLNVKNLFREQYAVHKKYDNSFYLLLLHKIKIFQISLVYRMIDLFNLK